MADAKVEETATASPSPPDEQKQVSFKVVQGKNAYSIEMPESSTVSDLKTKLEGLTGVHANMQKLLWRGNLPDTKQLKDCQLTPASKVMLIASAVEDVLKVNMPVAAKGAVAESKPLEAAQRWENMTEHKKVIEKGPPEEIPKPPAGKFPIPSNGIVGLLNRQGSKTRLTFKTGEDTLVISTAERTQPILYDAVKNVTSQAISGHDGLYHILALQLGPTEKSNYYLYWFPACYVAAVKEELLGAWQSFMF